MRKPRSGKIQLLSGLTLLSAMVVAFFIVQAPWAHPLRTLVLLALPGAQGALTAKNTLSRSRLNQFNGVLAIAELIGAGLLGVAAGIALLGARSLPVLYSSWIVAAIATLILVIAAALELLRAMSRRQNQRPVLLKLLLQSLALIFYGLLLLWMGLLFLLSLTGESYMGN
ncbi:MULTISPECIES: hypothetical protein [Cyanophyceae]|uniref:hypothetical protein n=1 Tax=Cyanophyceae TaxID=3028117 RepID=UPI0016870F6C|nr:MULTISPECIES: hypothetical protein [Cyanophyceae]MBD1919203.1 hypothetical protein [Phormidium sp. FACHB-77]MBD2033433.1 hypothetical protein [Phormidium sp. FACHB-322]MBD2054155.1 hypothetical protein [Leptolyngbya sp. FACHB-60]